MTATIIYLYIYIYIYIIGAVIFSPLQSLDQVFLVIDILLCTYVWVMMGKADISLEHSGERRVEKKSNLNMMNLF